MMTPKTMPLTQLKPVTQAYTSAASQMMVRPGRTGDDETNQAKQHDRQPGLTANQCDVHRFHVRSLPDHFDAAHPRAQHFGHDDRAVGLLVIFQHGDQGARHAQA